MADSSRLILILLQHDDDDDDDDDDDELTALVGTSTSLLGMILRGRAQDDIAACGPAMPKEEGGGSTKVELVS
jgi:hypothetical protein